VLLSRLRQRLLPYVLDSGWQGDGVRAALALQHVEVHAGVTLKGSQRSFLPTIQMWRPSG
jgi:hypothetical protein